ncbi:hypothetical protein HanXRQr2_Chr05g0218571 [Helianthus annuus]|uniref:Uncharacterized protein n=1 Tax=Helianthus annuus TaxID=4232 RepID=A0A9K3J1T1_HELAN|nr:hypothetical protein HanXRQr2_Chr05g0218571 [Helianthus annuus]KAJ0923040.1 hypothetical protein HanPSC8_Chr05g0210991 [Helianthus annuus]
MPTHSPKIEVAHNTPVLPKTRATTPCNLSHLMWHRLIGFLKNFNKISSILT